MKRTIARALRNAFFICSLFVFAVGVPVFSQTQSPFLESNILLIHDLDGEAVGDAFGWVGADLGDLNGDGAHEFGTTAPFGGNGSAGSAYIFDGKTAQLLNKVSGPEGSRLGYSMTSAGDVNADGTPDYVVGGFGPAGDVSLYSGLDHTLIFSMTSPLGVREGFGSAVNKLGDVNGDGNDDIVVGAQLADASDTVTDTGRIYVLSGLDGSLLWQKDGTTAQGTLGTGVGGIGDLNGDDLPDVIAGAPGAGENAMGEVYVLSGKDGGAIFTLLPKQEITSSGTFGTFFSSDAGDVDNDGTNDIFVGDYAANRGDERAVGRVYLYSGKDGSLIRLIEGEMAGDGIGPGRGIGDVNGDGHADQSIAAWQNSDAVPAGGKVLIYSGKDGSVLNVVTGALENDGLGVDAFGIGDVNEDGNPDYVVTATGLAFAGTDVGHVYVISFVEESRTGEMQFVSPFGGCQPIQPR